VVTSTGNTPIVATTNTASCTNAIRPTGGATMVAFIGYTISAQFV